MCPDIVWQLCVTHFVQHHVTDWWEALRLLYAGRHELETQEEFSAILTFPTLLSQVLRNGE